MSDLWPHFDCGTPASGVNPPITAEGGCATCPTLVIAATASGVGKTSLSLGLARALSRRGLRVATFKVGPDFLDPTYLAMASGRTCYNLDGWMTGRDYVRDLFARATAHADIAIVEGVMGLFDGASPTGLEGSTAEIAAWLDAPVLLVVNAHGAARSLAAMVKGFVEFDPSVRVAGVIANHAGSPRHTEWLADALSAASLPPLVGAVPRDGLPPLASRHLGLVTADATVLPAETIEKLADACEKHLDIGRIVNVAQPPSAVMAKPSSPLYRRNLPHIQATGRPIQITFSTWGRWTLPESVRSDVLKHCLHDNGTRFFIHAVVVMPDHVHMIINLRADSTGRPFGLPEILNGIKGASAHTVNKVIRRKGHVWQDENFDHVLRSDEDLGGKIDYLCKNPVRKGLVQRERDYPWIWRSWIEGKKVAGGITAGGGCATSRTEITAEGGCATFNRKVRIGLARDAAFHFYYPDNLQMLQSAGAELVEFSPLSDAALPADLAGLYLGGGYPEVFAERLAGNGPMREQIRRFAESGRCVYAECGGMIYLGRSVRTLDGRTWPMACVLPIDTAMLDRLKTLGYVEAELNADSMWGGPGQTLRGHEFHYSEITADDAAAEGWQPAYSLHRRRPTDSGPWARAEGFAKGGVLASYVHLHFASRPDAARCFVHRCEEDR